AIFAGRIGKNGGTGAIAEKARANEHADVVIKIHRGAADFDTYGENTFGAASGEQGIGDAQIRQGRAAALADEVEIHDIRAQTEPFANVTRQAGAEIAGASAGDD